MSIEEELFARYSFDEGKLAAYGFEPDGNALIYTATLPGGQFEATVVYDGEVSGALVDLDTGEEYTNFRMERARGFSAQVRQAYVDLLTDIRDECCQNRYFDAPQAQRICGLMAEAYGCAPEFLWPNIPSYAAFRREGNKKWFAVMGKVPRSKLDRGSGDAEPVEVLNVKVDPSRTTDLLAERGFYPAFHMSKKCWVSIILDDTLDDARIHPMIADSFESV